MEGERRARLGADLQQIVVVRADSEEGDEAVDQQLRVDRRLLSAPVRPRLQKQLILLGKEVRYYMYKEIRFNNQIVKCFNLFKITCIFRSKLSFSILK